MSSLEHRILLFDIDRGIGTLPFFFQRLHLALFVDGAVSGYPRNGPRLKQWGVGVGAELRLDIVLAYYLPMTVRLGYAHGWGQSGIDNVFLLLGQMF